MVNSSFSLLSPRRLWSSAPIHHVTLKNEGIHLTLCRGSFSIAFSLLGHPETSIQFYITGGLALKNPPKVAVARLYNVNHYAGAWWSGSNQ